MSSDSLPFGGQDQDGLMNLFGRFSPTNGQWAHKLIQVSLLAPQVKLT